MEKPFGNFRDKVEAFAGRFDERMRDTPRGKGPKALESTYWNIRDLFTQGVTREGLKQLIKQDTRDTFRFFTRQIDFAALRQKPWYVRYPKALWQVFLSLAYRLNPPRRVAFAIAIFAVLLGLLQSLTAQNGGRTSGALVWWMIGSAILFVLLLVELKDKLDLKGDLEIAREIQFGLVPSSPLDRGSFEINAFMRPANTVGGDYYDLIDLDENRLAVVVGDVSGKGMPAALLMALLQASLRTLITAGFRGAELIGRLNEYLCLSIPPNSMVTLFYGELDSSDGTLHYVNAGHNAPFLIRSDGSINRLAATSTLLGFMYGLGFDSETACVAPGDRVLLFTDGVTEAFNGAGEEYGEERLSQYLARNRQSKDGGLIRSLVDDVLAFCGPARPLDDMTIMTVERRSEG
ncbi:MAG: serine/threonine-protein phosphatase [Acidobacteria bacterium]|nr:serine/threonine-protein phosphatase [Acidobacteriota bacterium]